MFIAFLAKLTAYYLIPCFIYIIVKDIRSNKFNILKEKFYYPAFFTFMLLGLSYLILSYAIWGNPFERLIVVQSYTGSHLWSFKNFDLMEKIYRLIFFSINNADTIFLFYAITFNFHSIYQFFPGQRLVDLFYNQFIFYIYSSSSISTYEPMPLNPRFLYILLPGFYVISAYILSLIKINNNGIKNYSILFTL